jgi:tRNA dimethylallyltransferase
VNPFVLILGPTASGKSALGLKLAEHFSGCILNCDSLQTYKRLDIGTAKPSLAERAQVPHFLFDLLEPGEVLTAGDYRQFAIEVLANELPQRPVFGVGGSGFYIQALEKGMFDIPKPKAAAEEKIRSLLDKEGLPHLYELLKGQDPDYAQAINPNDAYRITRGLIIIEDSGRKVSDLKKDFKPRPFPFPLLKLGLAAKREFLLPRVVKRTQEMLAAGLVSEVKRLVEEGFGSWPALQSVGYRECMLLLNGAILETQLAPLITEKTIQLSKKQRTWFNRDPEIRWLDVENPFPQARDLTENFLAGKSEPS